MRQEKKSAYLVIETTGVLKKMCKQSSNFDIIRSQGKSDIRTYVRTRAYMSVCAHVRASRTRNEKYFPKLKFIISGIFFSLSLSLFHFLPSIHEAKKSSSFDIHFAGGFFSLPKIPPRFRVERIPPDDILRISSLLLRRLSPFLSYVCPVPSFVRT